MGATNCAPLIVGVPSTELPQSLKNRLAALNPVGFIVFKRNITSHAQVSEMIAELKELSSAEEPIVAVDQEGGRVNRFTDLPYVAPPQAAFGALYKTDPAKAVKAAALSAEVVASHLAQLGFTMNCVPCADVRQETAHEIIGDRAFSTDPEAVAALTAAVIQGTLTGGLWPIIKHAPGHGRAMADSHRALPKVTEPLAELAKSDFVPFKANNTCPFVMTAHIAYPALDADNCVTESYIALNYLRQNLGLSGLLVGDDLAMHALKGGLGERLTRGLRAGLDLAIWGGSDMVDFGAVASTYAQDLEALTQAAPALSPSTLARFDTLPTLRVPDIARQERAWRELQTFLPLLTP